MGSVLITGGAGYIGSHMVLELLEAGERVVVLDNLSTGHAWAVDKRAIFIRGDVADGPLTEALCDEHGITDIIHFAGSIVVPESVENPLKYYDNNTTASRNLIEVAVKAGVKNFIFSSTAAVYGMANVEPVGEDASMAPMSPYGRSKLMTEMMLADVAAAHALKFGVLRYFNVAGADPDGRTGQSTPNATHLIKVACQAALGTREWIEVFGTDYPTPDGTCLRDYIHVTDLVRAHSLLYRYLREGGDSVALNCGYGRGVSVRQVVEAVQMVSGVVLDVREADRRPGDPAAIIANAERIREVLGWQPQHDVLEEIVRSALDWESRLHNTATLPANAKT
jgi:UDP-glucose 4-epimerase